MKNYWHWRTIKRILNLYWSQYIWVPSTILNKIADVSAKESIRKGEDAQYLIPVTDLKSYWETKLRVAAKEWYREPGKHKVRKYFQCYYQNNGKAWFQRFLFQRKSIVSINRITGGYHCLNECLIQFIIINTEMCDCLDAKETTSHMLWHCKL